MSEIERNRILRLAPGCRLSDAQGQEDILLMPERALKLKGPTRAILQLCDGTRTLDGVVEELRRMYPAADPERISSETAALVEQLRDQGGLEYA